MKCVKLARCGIIFSSALWQNVFHEYLNQFFAHSRACGSPEVR
jgi:hypothetical protein